MYNRKMCRIYIVLPKNVPHQSVYNCVNLQVCDSKFTLTLFILYLVVYFFFFMYLNNRGREWMVVIMCEERETIKKMKKIDILIKCSIK